MLCCFIGHSSTYRKSNRGHSFDSDQYVEWTEVVEAVEVATVYTQSTSPLCTKRRRRVDRARPSDTQNTRFRLQMT